MQPKLGRLFLLSVLTSVIFDNSINANFRFHSLHKSALLWIDLDFIKGSVLKVDASQTFCEL